MAEKRLFHKIADAIIDMIQTDNYAVGRRLPGERELAKRFGVSRVVVREAEIALEAKGVLEIKGGSGVYVRRTVEGDLAALPKVTAFGLTQTRLLFEPECAALAATVITDAQITELEETVDRMASAPLGSKLADEADHAFHLAIAKATGNEANVVVLQNIWQMRTEIDAVKRVYLAVGDTDAMDRVKEHTDIMTALRDRDPEAARKAMRKHFTRLLKALLDFAETEAVEDARRQSSKDRDLYFRGGITS